MQTYYLDLSTLQKLLGDMPVLLCTPLPQGIPNHPYPSYGCIRLREGNIDACWIDGKDGFHLQGSLAMRSLQDREEWTVEVEQLHQPLPLPSTPSPSLSSDPSLSLQKKVFHQTVPLEEHLLLHLSRKERVIVRMVHLMIDGHRTVEQISYKLHFSSFTVEQAITTLQHVHVIEEVLLR